MYQHTEAFDRQITDPQRLQTRILSRLDPDDVPSDITDYFVDGTITVARQEIRTSATLTFSNDDGTMLPVGNPDHPLAPYGQELLPYRGVVYPDGTEELIPQGPLRVTAVRGADGGGKIEVRCFDRAWRIKRAKLETPYTINKGTPITSAIANVLRAAWGAIPLEVEADDATAGLTVLDAFADPWAECQALAASIGYELYFDRLGVCQLHPELETADSGPVAVYDDGSLKTLSDAMRQSDWHSLALSTVAIDWDTEDAHNVWIVRGENSQSGAIYQGISRILGSSSPLAYEGRFGRAVAGTIDTAVTSSTQAMMAATRRRVREGGIPEGVTIPAMLNPALELSDPVQVVRARLGLNQVHLVDGYTVPLRGFEQSIATRRRQVVVIGE